MPGSLLVGAAALLLLVLPATAHSAPGSWTRLHTGNASTAEPGLARTKDGTLHVVWQRTSAGRDDVVQQAISSQGALAGSTSVVTQGWQSINPRVELVAAETELRAFWAGTPGPGGPLAGPIVTATSTGAAWSAPTPVTAAVTAAGAAGIGVAVDRAGTTVVAQGDATPGTNLVRVGSGPEVRYETAGCCAYDPELGVDSVSGDVVLGWFSNAPGRRGLWTQAVTAAGLVGTRAAVPGSGTSDGASAVAPAQRTAITGRIGAGGVYLAYGAGFPSFGSLDLLRVGGTPLVVARGTVFEHVGIAAAPEGRLWIFWSHRDYYLAARSSRGATRFGTATKLALPSEGVSTFGLYGEGSSGPLDLVAHAGTGTAVPDWHTQVLPRLSLVVTAHTFTQGERKLRRVALRLTDAGDAVRGAVVRLATRSLRTDASGRATIVVPSTGKQVVARATKAGYAAVTTRVRL